MKPLKHFIITVLLIIPSFLLYSQVKRLDTYFSSESFANASEIKVFKSDNYIMLNYFDNQLVSLAIMKKGTTNPDDVMVFSLYDTGVDIKGNAGVVHRVYECKPDEYTENRNFFSHISIDSKKESLMLYDDNNLLGGYVLDYLVTSK